jgi:hypothetical protein
MEMKIGYLRERWIVVLGAKSSVIRLPAVRQHRIMRAECVIMNAFDSEFDSADPQNRCANVQSGLARHSFLYDEITERVLYLKLALKANLRVRPPFVVRYDTGAPSIAQFR